MARSYDYGYDPEYDEVDYGFAADAARSERVAFIRKTYAHLFGAILAFIGIQAIIFNVEPLKVALVTAIAGHWWIAFIAFMLVSWLAEKWAHSDTSQGMQYFGLAVYTVAEALIFVPLLFIASQWGGGDIIPTAAFITLLIFGGLTAVVFLTKQDFSFLRGILVLGSLAALGAIICSLIFQFTLGIVFVIAMIVLLSGFILYHTSNVLHHYHTSQHVAASLALFASIATLFWYVIRLLMIVGDD